MRQTWETILQPTTLSEALTLRQELGNAARVIAGGTDVVVELSRGVKPTNTLLDLSRIEELRGIRQRDGFITLGALATHNDVLASEICRTAALPLAQACLEIGAPQLRARATIAGNIVTASPANDTISALLALDAEVEVQSVERHRWVPITDFHTGFRQTVLAEDELVTAIRVRELQPDQRGLFIKLGLRQAQAISVIHLAIMLDLTNGEVTRARVALGCLAPTVVRGANVEAHLVGKLLSESTIAEAGRVVLSDVQPIDDIRGSAAYRKLVLSRLLQDGLRRIASGREREGFEEVPILLESGTTYPNSWAKSAPETSQSNTIALEVNGQQVTWPTTAIGKTLLDALRDDSGLTGAKEGCAEGECGACTVWMDGRAVMSCLVPAAQARGTQVTSIEGLSAIHPGEPDLHPLQQAFVDQAAVQCGFCIPGMVMAGAKLLEELPLPTDPQIQRALSGNICRCTGYRKILAAVRQAAGGDA